MSDDEWERLKASYERGGRPMPRVVKTATTDRMRAWLGMVGMYAIGALEVFASVGMIRRARTALDLQSPIQTLIGVALIVGGAHIAMRGTFGRSVSTPGEVLAALERRNAGRKKLLHMMPWFVGFFVVTSLAGDIAHVVIADKVADVVASFTIQASALALVVWALRQMRRKMTRDTREIAEARRLLDDSS
jgi:hypothetical protein